MKTIKLIDLFVKLANCEEVPKKIRYYSDLYEIDYCYMDYKNKYINDTYLLRDVIHSGKELCNKIEVVEEVIEYTPKEDKKIKDKARFQYSQIPLWSDMIDIIRITNENFEKHQKALNEIIDRLNGE